MSPARSKRQAIPHRRSRTDILQAVGLAAGIVAATALLVWLMRPGPSGIPATGGLMNRQPRASWLVGGGIGVAAIASWFILRGRHATRARAKVQVPIALGVVLAGTVVGGFVWPGGLLRHDVAPPPVPKTPATTTTVARATTTTIPSPSTVGVSTTTSSGATTAPTTGTSNAATSTTQTPTTPSR